MAICVVTSVHQTNVRITLLKISSTCKIQSCGKIQSSEKILLAHTVLLRLHRACPPPKEKSTLLSALGTQLSRFRHRWTWESLDLGEKKALLLHSTAEAAFSRGKRKTPPVANFSPSSKLSGPRRQMPVSGDQ